jgi:hypothetical protein
LGRANWYMPRWLDRIVPNLGVEVDVGSLEHPVEHSIDSSRGGEPLTPVGA